MLKSRAGRILFEIVEQKWGFWITSKDELLAGVIRGDYQPKSVEFVTPNSFGLQVAVMSRSKDYEIPSHSHLPVPRALVGTQEVLIIKSGVLRADIFDSARVYVCSVELRGGDTIILNSGGHGFMASEDCFFIEVKQGPYVEGKDKEIFPSIGQTLQSPRIIG